MFPHDIFVELRAIGVGNSTDDCATEGANCRTHGPADHGSANCSCRRAGGGALCIGCDRHYDSKRNSSTPDFEAHGNLLSVSLPKASAQQTAVFLPSAQLISRKMVPMLSKFSQLRLGKAAKHVQCSV